MNIIMKQEVNRQFLLDLNEFIHGATPLYEYHMKHIDLVQKYAAMLNKKLSTNVDNNKIEIISLAHDLFKERSLIKDKEFMKWRGYQIPQDINRYIRLNLHILEKYGIDEFFNSDIQLHPQAAGLFLINEFGISDPSILYPIMFHSCPIISIYETLDHNIRNMIDIITLADKLSSNYLKINFKNSSAVVDLDQVVFGTNGNEFNYTLGLYLARLISQGTSKGEQSILATNYYHKRLYNLNPLVSKKSYSLKRLGGNKVWPKRNPLHLMTY